jgi:hypothetical protein
MPPLDITFLRLDRDDDPTVVEAFFRSVDWLVMPREGEGLEIHPEQDPVTVESVGYGFDGYPTVMVGRVVLDDLQAAQLRKVGWRVVPLPGGPAR